MQIKILPHIMPTHACALNHHACDLNLTIGLLHTRRYSDGEKYQSATHAESLTGNLTMNIARTIIVAEHILHILYAYIWRRTNHIYIYECAHSVTHTAWWLLLSVRRRSVCAVLTMRCKWKCLVCMVWL